jgi:hypothetical protein
MLTLKTKHRVLLPHFGKIFVRFCIHRSHKRYVIFCAIFSVFVLLDRVANTYSIQNAQILHCSLELIHHNIIFFSHNKSASAGLLGAEIINRTASHLINNSSNIMPSRYACRTNNVEWYYNRSKKKCNSRCILN